METDFLKELEYLGVTARLKRLSDALSASIREYYRENGVDLEPSWHLVLLFLKRHGPSTMTELAGALDLSLPAMTKMIRRMEARGYLEAVPDGEDGRKKPLHLTRKATMRLPEFERIWHAGQQSVRDILSQNEAFLEQLEHFEDRIGRRSFRDRAMEHLYKG